MSARPEVGTHPAQPFQVLLSRGAEPEGAAEHGHAVGAGELEPVQRLHGEMRRRADACGGLAAGGDHVGGGVDAVDVETGRDPRHEQTPGAAPDVERRLAGLHVGAEVLDLGTVGVEQAHQRATSP